MKKKLLITSILAIGLVSCGAEGSSKIEEDKPVVAVVEEVKAQTPHELELNGDEKWIVDDGMTVAISKIESILTTYQSNKVFDYQLLGDSIGVQTKKIIRSCTMKGKGHDELHKWLLPFLDLKKALIMTSSPEEGAALLEDIKDEVAIYNEYFK